MAEDLSYLIAKLNNTQLQVSNPPLWELIRDLIKSVAGISGAGIGPAGARGPAGPTPVLEQTFVTSDAEPTLTNSRKLIAGSNISLNTTFGGQMVISATGGGGNHASTHSSGGTDPVDVKNLAGYPGDTTLFLRGDNTFAVLPVTSISHYDSPLTDGDLDETDLIFASGECIIVQVPI